ncbi:hypothetical protein CRE_24831 [Caenorhabditis remanei]|uniref:Uncharacterized protein n=1 Tax=Caenorhabditis remanei TaxID=31234 RepID=E3NJ30_CAERE|nr:hypothetical protein CRE_24831 [Caenorhabditis remanei]
MKYLILLFAIFLSVSCCFITKNSVVCECSDIRDLITRDESENASEPIYSEGAGCERNVTCGFDESTYVRIYLHQSEIEFYDRPDWGMGYLDSMGSDSEIFGKPVNVFSYFGMVCEDGDWYATKYPFGVYYATKENWPNRVGLNGKVDGLKSLIAYIACKPPIKPA